MPKRKYYAIVKNEAGERFDVPSRTQNKSRLIKYIREHYGPGWTAYIFAIDLDDDGQTETGERHLVASF